MLLLYPGIDYMDGLNRNNVFILYFRGLSPHRTVFFVFVSGQELERSRNAAEGREGIEKFEGSLKEVLAQKWKYL